jgi:two-component system, OmpR family, response regulator
MTNEGKKLIFLVDDDELFLKSLEIEFKQNNFNVEMFATGELCVEMLSLKPDVVVLDYHLNSIKKNAMNGLKTLDKIKAFNPLIPIIMLSSQDSIEVAINCMKHKAYDYIVKSETAFLRLQKAINSYFEYRRIETTLNWYVEKYNF